MRWPGSGSSGSGVISPGLVQLATTEETVEGSTAMKAVTPAGYVAAEPFIDVRRYGATGDGTTNDSTAIQAALIEAGSTGTVRFPPGDYNIGETGLTASCSIEMMPEAVLQYSGTGTALLVDAAFHGKIAVDIRKTPTTWHTGADTTSIGLQIRNTDYARVRAVVHNFCVGVDLHGDNAGSSYGVIDCVNLMDNKIGLRFSKAGTGWANQWEVRGQIRINSSYTAIAGSRYIDMSTAGNNITFINVTLEANTPEYTVECDTNYNVWLNCRWEDSPGILFDGTNAGGNLIIGGYSNLGPNPTHADGVTVTLTGGASPPMILSNAGSYISQSGVGSQEGIILFGGTSSAYGVITMRSTFGSTADAFRGQITGGGRIHLYKADGKAVGTFPEPVIDIDTPNGRLYVGDGTVTSTTYLQAVSSTVTQFNGQWRFNTAPQYTATGTSPVLWFGTNVNHPKMFHGTGSPEGVVAAGPGSSYFNDSGGAGTTLYVKESGTGNTGWVGK
jgi:hypothetical protein